MVGEFFDIVQGFAVHFDFVKSTASCVVHVQGVARVDEERHGVPSVFLRECPRASQEDARHVERGVEGVKLHVRAVIHNKRLTCLGMHHFAGILGVILPVAEPCLERWGAHLHPLAVIKGGLACRFGRVVGCFAAVLLRGRGKFLLRVCPLRQVFISFNICLS